MNVTTYSGNVHYVGNLYRRVTYFHACSRDNTIITRRTAAFLVLYLFVSRRGQLDNVYKLSFISAVIQCQDLLCQVITVKVLKDCNYVLVTNTVMVKLPLCFIKQHTNNKNLL
jgi:hypothetical protein